MYPMQRHINVQPSTEKKIETEQIVS